MYMYMCTCARVCGDIGAHSRNQGARDPRDSEKKEVEARKAEAAAAQKGLILTPPSSEPASRRGRPSHPAQTAAGGGGGGADSSFEAEGDARRHLGTATAAAA